MKVANDSFKAEQKVRKCIIQMEAIIPEVWLLKKKGVIRKSI
jgi:hypothetical protein